MRSVPDDPDRLLLAGAMLHFNDQREQAIPLLEQSARKSKRPFRANVLLTAGIAVRDESFQGPESLVIESDRWWNDNNVI